MDKNEITIIYRSLRSKLKQQILAKAKAV